MNQEDTGRTGFQEEQSGTEPIEVLVSEDGMTAFIKLTKPKPEAAPAEPLTGERLLAELQDHGIVYGIKEAAVEKLAERPIYNIRIEVAKGLPPVKGSDGENHYLVKRDSEYQPEFTEEGVIDYKNLEYFQIARKGQPLCEIVKETRGEEGMNVFGGPIPTRHGRPAPYPGGTNTEMNEDGTLLTASCDGIIRFLRDTVDVSETLRIAGDVDQHTGNINFSGDVTVEGDVCSGYTVRSGGNVVVKGVVEDAAIQAEGSIHVAKGINGNGKKEISLKGNLRCKYIENAIIDVKGDLIADYIIDSKITCGGDVTLSGAREVVLGGEMTLKGELRARDLGSEKGRITVIEIAGEKIVDQEKIDWLISERDNYGKIMMDLYQKTEQLSQVAKQNRDEELIEKLTFASRQLTSMKENINKLNFQIEQLEKNWRWEFPGAVVCKRKMYQGVRLSFGSQRFSFNLDSLEHCRISRKDGEIIQSTL